MRPHEIESAYEWNTGQAIVRRFAGMDPLALPGVLVAGHAPFCWGQTPAAAAHIAVILEEIAAWRGTRSPSTRRRQPLPRAARQALPPQARPQGVLRAGVIPSNERLAGAEVAFTGFR